MPNRTMGINPAGGLTPAGRTSPVPLPRDAANSNAHRGMADSYAPASYRPAPPPVVRPAPPASNYSRPVPPPVNNRHDSSSDVLGVIGIIGAIAGIAIIANEISNQPTYPSYPSYPSYPQYPSYPSYPSYPDHRWPGGDYRRDYPGSGRGYHEGYPTRPGW